MSKLMLFGPIGFKNYFLGLSYKSTLYLYNFSLPSPPTLPVSPDLTPSGIPNLSYCCACACAHVPPPLPPHY